MICVKNHTTKNRVYQTTRNIFMKEKESVVKFVKSCFLLKQLCWNTKSQFMKGKEWYVGCVKKLFPKEDVYQSISKQFMRANHPNVTYVKKVFQIIIPWNFTRKGFIQNHNLKWTSTWTKLDILFLFSGFYFISKWDNGCWSKEIPWMWPMQ